MRRIDLRSDTVTKPTDKMREAMYRAEVGDDVYRDDPSVIELENRAAEIFHKEDALFVPSGTMGNQIAVLSHTQRGDEIILEETSHIYFNEVGGLAVLAGVQAHTIKGNHGALEAKDVENAIREDNIHYPKTSLICLENTHNRSGGRVVPLDKMKAVYEVGKKYNIPVHLDGARVFNAATFLDVDVQEISQYTDTLNVCLSKGLCAPIGSILLGDKKFIEVSRKNRKLLGGGMRQAGILAAAGMIALEEMSARLQEDHDNAMVLAKGLAEIPGIEIHVESIQTNIIMLDISGLGMNGNELAAKLKHHNIFINGARDGHIRLVTHADISGEDVKVFLEILKELV